MSPRHDLALFRRLTAALIVLWCILGAFHTGERLLDRHVGWNFPRPPEARGAVGLPLRGADHVTTLLDILRERSPGMDTLPWLVVYPPTVDRITLQYIRAQLAHSLYPIRVDVIAMGARPLLPRYRGVITPPELEFSNLGSPVLLRAGFRAYGWPAK